MNNFTGTVVTQYTIYGSLKQPKGHDWSLATIEEVGKAHLDWTNLGGNSSKWARISAVLLSIGEGAPVTDWHSGPGFELSGELSNNSEQAVDKAVQCVRSLAEHITRRLALGRGCMFFTINGKQYKL